MCREKKGRDKDRITEQWKTFLASSIQSAKYIIITTYIIHGGLKIVDSEH